MIIWLGSMKPSGDGTPMLSKAGDQTTYIYPCFSRDKWKSTKKTLDEDSDEQPYQDLTQILNDLD